MAVVGSGASRADRAAVLRWHGAAMRARQAQAEQPEQQQLEQLDLQKLPRAWVLKDSAEAVAGPEAGRCSDVLPSTKRPRLE
mmetsp:Transcript_3715/g.9278  ORF Transcript_3715/g.9278 Transcript_3715/m.9278 type:complete len:82 (+) Transcript_3715:3697-3942(+)